MITVGAIVLNFGIKFRQQMQKKVQRKTSDEAGKSEQGTREESTGESRVSRYRGIDNTSVQIDRECKKPALQP